MAGISSPIQDVFKACGIDIGKPNANAMHLQRKGAVQHVMVCDMQRSKPVCAHPATHVLHPQQDADLGKHVLLLRGKIPAATWVSMAPQPNTPRLAGRWMYIQIKCTPSAPVTLHIHVADTAGMPHRITISSVQSSAKGVTQVMKPRVTVHHTASQFFGFGPTCSTAPHNV